MKVEARDRDDPNTLHAELRYGQLDQTPRIPSSQMFFINPRTGDVSLTEEGEASPYENVAPHDQNRLSLLLSRTRNADPCHNIVGIWQTLLPRVTSNENSFPDRESNPGRGGESAES